jgi:methyl-accepting chemotaxis protein
MVIDKFKISSKIWLPAIIFTIALVCVAAFAAKTLHTSLLQDRQDKIRSIVEEAHSVVEFYVSQAKSGNLSTELAQASAIATIKSIRYDGTEYLWINDVKNIMIMHPIKPALDGKMLDKLQDPNGKYLFTEFINAVKNDNGAGFVDYLWPKPGFDEPVEKISYVKLSNEWGWIIGTGLYLDDVQVQFRKMFQMFAVIVIISFIVAGGISTLVARSLSGGLARLSGEMAELAQGNLSLKISGQERADEIGDMARAVDVFKLNAIEAEQLKIAQEEQRAQAEKERKKSLIDLADGLQSHMKNALEAMNKVVSRLDLSADELKDKANATSQEASSVAAISEQTSSNVQTVAAATEELNASSSEIGRQIEHTNQTAQTAAHEAEKTNEVILGLSGAAAKIGEVVNMIQNIAEQTNLLALNATIEAARAGDAGKGFAVVASEVKNLANQTARATDEVSKQIGAIQSETERAVEAIAAITTTINNVHEASSAITDAVEQQNAAIQEISMNIQEAARGTQEISSHIHSVSDDANQTMDSAQNVKAASQELIESSHFIDQSMETFIHDMRSN